MKISYLFCLHKRELHRTQHNKMKEELKKQMQEIVANLLPGDKSRACREIGISEPTLNKYLSGDIVKFDVADKIISFFKK